MNAMFTRPFGDAAEARRFGQLSQGIDSLRAQLIALSEGDESELEMRIITSAGWDSIKATYEDDTWDIN